MPVCSLDVWFYAPLSIAVSVVLNVFAAGSAGAIRVWCYIPLSIAVSCIGAIACCLLQSPGLVFFNCSVLQSPGLVL